MNPRGPLSAIPMQGSIIVPNLCFLFQILPEGYFLFEDTFSFFILTLFS